MSEKNETAPQTQLILPTPEQGKMSVGFTAAGSVQDVRLLARVTYGKRVQANIKVATAELKAAQTLLKDAEKAFEDATKAYKPPKDFTNDVKTLHTALKKFFPSAVLPWFSGSDESGGAGGGAGEDDDDDFKPGESKIETSVVVPERKMRVKAVFTGLSGSTSRFSTVRDYPYTKDIDAAADAVADERKKVAAAETRLAELRRVLQGVDEAADEAAAVVAAHNLKNSGELGKELLDELTDTFNKRALADGLAEIDETQAQTKSLPESRKGARS